MSQHHYAGAIWTNHALERLIQRGLSQELAGQAFSSPDRIFSGKQPGTQERQKKFENSLVTIISKQNERHEWIILSAWIDPPLPGTADYKKKKQYLRYKNAGFWERLWYILIKQLGF